ncbi:UDP-N-acetylmuramoyl-L-alanine--D-glutamate ligase [Candidatus Gracilibacteria bacterium]|nr:UDP-N-acetylmuramoyl-L-alanine--D-glutamate ligase [Candidatus Gracilibacteria bacterium]
MLFSNLKDSQNILLYGYGTEGKSTKKFLQKHFPELKITTFQDYKPAVNFVDYDLIVLSPGVPKSKVKNIPLDKITSQTELFFSNLPEEKRKKVIGITGTKGKSTTVKFCQEMLENTGHTAKIGGNYGVPLLNLFDDFLANKFEFVVAELSSYQLENLSISPGIAIFLNFFQDHLDRHHTMQNYFLAKKNLWSHQQSGDHFIVTENSRNLIGQTPQRPIFTSKIPADFFPKNSIFRAEHWLENFGTVKKLAEILNIPEEVVFGTAQNFKGLPHRLEFFKTRKDIKFYDDAISVNPDATMAAVSFLGENLGSIILGGQDRKQNFSALIAKLSALDVQIIVLESEVSESLLKNCQKNKVPQQNISVVKDLKEAVETAFAKTPPKHICLLSPAAPSYDQFKNFEEKGDLFQKLVKKF